MTNLYFDNNDFTDKPIKTSISNVYLVNTPGFSSNNLYKLSKNVAQLNDNSLSQAYG